MLSEFRTIDQWRESVEWGDGQKGRVHLTLWGELPCGPAPHDLRYDKSVLQPSHLIGELVWDAVGDDVEERSEPFRIYKKDSPSDWMTLFLDSGKPIWDNILMLAAEKMPSDVNLEGIVVREDG